MAKRDLRKAKIPFPYYQFTIQGPGYWCLTRQALCLCKNPVQGGSRNLGPGCWTVLYLTFQRIRTRILDCADFHVPEYQDPDIGLCFVPRFRISVPGYQILLTARFRNLGPGYCTVLDRTFQKFRTRLLDCADFHVPEFQDPDIKQCFAPRFRILVPGYQILLPARFRN